MDWLTLQVSGQSVSLPALLTLGASVGVVAGMFGVGGGFLLVPFMNVVLGIPFPAAVGAGLCVTIANSVGSHLRYRQCGAAESRFDWMLLGGSFLGVDAGARLLTYLRGLGEWTVSGVTLDALSVIITGSYAILFFVVSFFLWTRHNFDVSDTKGKGPLAKVGIPPLVNLPVAGIGKVSGPLVGVIGFCNGMLSGLLGIGGGICLIPIMLFGFGFSIQKTAGTGVLVVLAVGLAGTFQHARLGNVHLGLAMVLMVGSAVFAQIGTLLTTKLPDRLLKRALAILLVFTVVLMFAKLFHTAVVGTT